jgi:hypothetical protein
VTEKSTSLDLLGVKPIADAAQVVVNGAMDGASAFLSRICLPAAEEFGLLLRDKVGAWRARNAVAIANSAERLLGQQSASADEHAHPRLVGQILENGSWSDSDEVVNLWAGLLASSCSKDGDDDSNLMFVDLLSRLSVSQVCTLSYAIEHAPKEATEAGWLSASFYAIELAELVSITGIDDYHRLDRELDHLRSIGLIDPQQGGFNMRSRIANLTPTTLALQLYVRGHGHRGDPLSFFKLDPPAT